MDLVVDGVAIRTAYPINGTVSTRLKNAWRLDLAKRALERDLHSPVEILFNGEVVSNYNWCVEDVRNHACINA